MKKKTIQASIAALVTTLFSYFINNKGQCCDQIFQAGWPFAFYGGNGGFLGKTESQIIWSGLLFDFILWFILVFVITLALTKIGIRTHD